MSVLADVPHLVKNLRNHFVSGQPIKLPGDMTKYNLPSDVVNVELLQQLVAYQKDKDLKPAPNLVEKHLQPSHFEKMKLSHAMVVFSHSVSAALQLMIEEAVLPQEARTTAWFVETVGHWFDIMCSRYPTLALSKFDTEKYNQAVGFLADR